MMSTLDELQDLDAASLANRCNKSQPAKYLEDALRARRQGDLVAGMRTESNDENDSSVLRQLRDMVTQTLQTVTSLDNRMGRYEEKVNQLEAENAVLKNEIKLLWSVVDDQVRHMEFMDRRDRSKNLIILGIPEGQWNGWDLTRTRYG